MTNLETLSELAKIVISQNIILNKSSVFVYYCKSKCCHGGGVI